MMIVVYVRSRSEKRVVYKKMKKLINDLKVRDNRIHYKLALVGKEYKCLKL